MKTLTPIQPRRRRSASPRLLVSSSPSLPVSSSPFDPALPEDGALIVAEVLRDQFNALNADIQTRATEAQLSAEVAALEAAIAQCATQGQLNSAVAGLNSAIDQRITQEQLDAGMGTATGNAINAVLPQTSNNTNGVLDLNLMAAANYDQGQMQTVIDKVDELINALKRW